MEKRLRRLTRAALGGIPYRHEDTVSLVLPDHPNLQPSGAVLILPNTPDQPGEG